MQTEQYSDNKHVHQIGHRRDRPTATQLEDMEERSFSQLSFASKLCQNLGNVFSIGLVAKPPRPAEARLSRWLCVFSRIHKSFLAC